MSFTSVSKPKNKFGRGGTASCVISNTGSGMHGQIQSVKPGIDAWRGYKGGQAPAQNPEPTTKTR